MKKKQQPIQRRTLADFKPEILPTAADLCAGDSVESLIERGFKPDWNGNNIAYVIQGEIGTYLGERYLPFHGLRSVVRFAHLTAFMERKEFRLL